MLVNGKPSYSGNNRWRTRDYRYLGTVGFFDTVILNLEKGDNTTASIAAEKFGMSLAITPEGHSDSFHIQYAQRAVDILEMTD